MVCLFTDTTCNGTGLLFELVGVVPGYHGNDGVCVCDHHHHYALC